MRGTFSRVTGSSASSAAATMGSAAFLFPDGRMVPERVCPPSTTNCSALMRDGAVDGEGLDEDRAARSASCLAPPVAEWRSLDMTGLRNQASARCMHVRFRGPTYAVLGNTFDWCHTTAAPYGKRP